METLEIKTEKGGLTGTSWVLPEADALETGKSYCWRVLAQDRAFDLPTPSASGAFFVPWPDQPAKLPREDPLLGRTDVTAYQMISFPLSPATKDPGELLKESLGAYNPSEWRIFRHEGQELIEFSPKENRLIIAPGRGYWLISQKGGRITVTGTPVGLDEPFTIPLPDKGWNEIGHPFGFPVDWDRVQVRCRPEAEPVPIGSEVNDCVDTELKSYEMDP